MQSYIRTSSVQTQRGSVYHRLNFTMSASFNLLWIQDGVKLWTRYLGQTYKIKWNWTLYVKLNKLFFSTAHDLPTIFIFYFSNFKISPTFRPLKSFQYFCWNVQSLQYPKFWGELRKQQTTWKHTKSLETTDLQNYKLQKPLL